GTLGIGWSPLHDARGGRLLSLRADRHPREQGSQQHHEESLRRLLRRSLMTQETTPSQEELNAIIDRVQARLDELGSPTGVRLQVDVEDSKWDDGWFYVSVANLSPGKIRASEYSEWYTQIERELRKDETINTILVPVRP